MFKSIFILCILIVIVSCRTINETNFNTGIDKLQINQNKIILFDSARNRKIPIVIYYPKIKVSNQISYLVLLSHGYGFNEGNPYLGYSFIAENLAKKGCYVVSIQHELPTDELLAMSGELRITRKPNWEKGVSNINYVKNQLIELYPFLVNSNLVLIGHSNGGDMSVLFAEKFPNIVHKVFTLDHRRMPIPRIHYPKFFSLRSSNQVADEGVLPDKEELKLLNHIVLQTTIKHNDMCNSATKKEKRIILSFIEQNLGFKSK